MGDEYTFERTKDIDLVYEKLGKERYRLFTWHKKGSKEYRCNSDEITTYWRDRKDLNAVWQAM
ncbi:MAG: hypothetical protein OEW15_10035 [Nitrospirota bacterium]|nr:hypothetical protein [Nitrospirota bacterium]